MDIINIKYMSESAYLIIAVTSLATAVVTLWVKNDRLHKKYSEQSNENFLKSLEIRKEEATAKVLMAKSNEHLANSIDSFPERILDKMLANGVKKKG